jgi:hypothetical protein
MQPDELAVTIKFDLSYYEYHFVRLVTPYDANRLDRLRAEALKFVRALDNIIEVEIGEVYAVARKRGLQHKKLPNPWSSRLEEALAEHPHWEWDTGWNERVC